MYSCMKVRLLSGYMAGAEIVNISSRLSIKIKSTTKKSQGESRDRGSTIRKGGRLKKKTTHQIEEEESEKSDNINKINSTESPITGKELQLEMPISAEIDNIPGGSSGGDNSKINKGKKHHITVDATSTEDNTSTRKSYLTPKRSKRSKISNKSKSYSSITSSKRNRRESLKDKTNKGDNVSSISHSIFPVENQQNSTNIDIDNNRVSDKLTTDDVNTNYTSNGISQENNYFATDEHTVEPSDYNIDPLLQNSCIEENTQANKPLDKDSGRSTLLKSNISDDSNLRTSKLLTGRINKKYKKRDNICNKISKVISRSINNSREVEILNGNEPNMVDSSSVAQTPETDPSASEYINLLCNNNVVSMKYVEKKPNFKRMDNLMVTNILKNIKDGPGMGYLKLPPGSQKPLHVARKFSLYYFVVEGEAFIQVHNKSSKLEKFSNFIIPLGTEYSIINMSKEDPLTLAFVKVASNVESH